MDVLFCKRNILLFLVCTIGYELFAQSGTVSPLSRTGFGEIVDNAPVALKGMGGTVIGIRNNDVINPLQPASYTSCDSATFMFDLAAHGAWVKYSDIGGVRNKAIGNLDYVTLQIPLWKKYMALSVGLMPYTQAGYSYSQYDSIPNTAIKYYNIFAGEGGITDFYVGLGANIKHWVALGVNFYYMFGNVDNDRSLTFNASGLNDITQTTRLKVGNIRLRYGLQVFHTFAEKHAFVLGGIFENKKVLHTSFQTYQASLDDSITFTPVSAHAFQEPMTYGLGLSYTYAERLTVAVDYECQKWSKCRYKGENGYFQDYTRLAFGVEYRHAPFGARSYAQRMYWRLGGNIVQPYDPSVEKKGYNISLGMGFPLPTTSTIFNLSVEYGHRGSSSRLEEHMLKLTINATINEHWFFKRKL